MRSNPLARGVTDFVTTDDQAAANALPTLAAFAPSSTPAAPQPEDDTPAALYWRLRWAVLHSKRADRSPLSSALTSWQYDARLETAQRARIAAGSVLGVTSCAVEAFEPVVEWLHGCSAAQRACLGLDEAAFACFYETFTTSSDVKTEDFVTCVVKPVMLALQEPFLHFFLGFVLAVGVATPVPGRKAQATVAYTWWPMVDTVTDFHSYTWLASLTTTCAEIKEALPDAVNPATGSFVHHGPGDAHHYWWWDIFCQNQHHTGDVQATFRAVLSTRPRFFLSVPNPLEPAPFTRIWCVFEIAVAMEKGLAVGLLTSGRHSVIGSDLLVVPDDEVMDAYFSAKPLVDLARATATRPAVCSDVWFLRTLGGLATPSTRRRDLGHCARFGDDRGQHRAGRPGAQRAYRPFFPENPPGLVPHAR